MSRLLLLIAVSIASLPLLAEPQRIEITVEREDGTNWTTVPANLVFNKSDHLRFRVRTNFDGYLYVMNYGTSGQYAKLFPLEETGLDNNIKAGTEYLIPSTQTSFRVDGPPGYDIVYWIVSPLELTGTGPPPKPSKPVQKMLPRCDDTLLRARGLCLDASAGARNITGAERLPSNLADVPRAGSRDLTIVNEKQQSVITSAAQGPVLYEFRVAHQ